MIFNILAANLTDPNWAYTVLAPVNDAFEEAATSLNITLTELTSSPDLVHILENHLLAYPLTVSSCATFRVKLTPGATSTGDL